MKNKIFTLIFSLFLCSNITACTTTHYRSSDLNNNSFSPIIKTSSNKNLASKIISQLEKNHKTENHLDKYDSTNKIEGKSLSNISSVLGKPDILKKELEAKIATYKSEICTINIFTYQENGKYITKYAESNSVKTNKKVSFNNCLASIFLNKFK